MRLSAPSSAARHKPAPLPIMEDRAGGTRRAGGPCPPRPTRRARNWPRSTAPKDARVAQSKAPAPATAFPPCRFHCGHQDARGRVRTQSARRVPLDIPRLAVMQPARRTRRRFVTLPWKGDGLNLVLPVAIEASGGQDVAEISPGGPARFGPSPTGQSASTRPFLPRPAVPLAVVPSEMSDGRHIDGRGPVVAPRQFWRRASESVRSTFVRVDSSRRL